MYFKILKLKIILHVKKIGLNESETKMKESLDSDEYIISKKVLKKEVKSSKINIEVFYKIYENIGYTSKIEEINIGSENGSSN